MDSEDKTGDNEVDRLKRIEFLESLRDWFEGHEYFPYELADAPHKKAVFARPTRVYQGQEPRLSLDDEDSAYHKSDYLPGAYHDTVDEPFPYAYMGPNNIHMATIRHPSYTVMVEYEGKVMFAQDVKGRHVVIKRVKGGSEEYDVVRFLKDRTRLRNRDSFPSVIPILDLLPYNGDWFLVMPRWEEKELGFATRFFSTFHAAIQYVISVLKGLAFLHEHRIFHRDIVPRNILVNHFSSYAPTFLQHLRSHRYLQAVGAVTYALSDFDMAMLLDEKTYGPNPRLPIQKTLQGAQSHPYETMHAHIDFDPFKYDVACLGILFAENFQHIIVDDPLLAPLIDRMVTPNIGKRFTALEALQFAQNTLPTISHLRDIRRRPPNPAPVYFESDRWAGLSADFIKQWGKYRVHTTWAMRFQNWCFEPDERWNRLYYFKYTVHVLTFVPHLIFRRVLSLNKLFRRIGQKFLCKSESPP